MSKPFIAVKQYLTIVWKLSRLQQTFLSNKHETSRKPFREESISYTLCLVYAVHPAFALMTFVTGAEKSMFLQQNIFSEVLYDNMISKKVALIFCIKKEDPFGTK